MSVGIEIYNDNNVLQITDKFRNLQFIKKGSAIINAPQAQYTKYVKVEFDPSTKFVAFRCTNSTTLTLTMNYMNKTGEFYSTSFYGENGTEVTWYEFGYPTLLSSSNSGLQVYNSENELVFSSNAKYMRVIDHRSGTITRDYVAIDPSQQLVTYPFGTVPAIMVGTTAQWSLVGTMVNIRIIMLVFSFSDTTVKTEMKRIVQTPNFPGENLAESFEGNYNYLVVDVANL